jgi:hypothetical protein
MVAIDIEVIVVDATDEGFARREFFKTQRELNRIPEWMLAEEMRIKDTGRTECSKRHLFVNAMSKFCHICGEAR